MRIGKMQEYILIAFIKCFDLADRPFHSLGRRQVIRVDDEPMEAARDTVVNALRGSHDVDAVVPELRRAFRERLDSTIDLPAETVIKHLQAVHVKARFHSSQRRVCIFCSSIVIVEYDSRGEKSHEIGHRPVAFPFDLTPAKGVDKDIEH